MRFGLNGQPGFTLKEIADAFGVGIERVRQLERKAIWRLQGIASEIPHNYKETDDEDRRLAKNLTEADWSMIATKLPLRTHSSRQTRN